MGYIFRLDNSQKEKLCSNIKGVVAKFIVFHYISLL
jgi:hypothetical protein